MSSGKDTDPPAAGSSKDLPAEVEAALTLLEPGNTPEQILPACQALIDYTETFRDFRSQCPSSARAIQRKGFKLMEMKHPKLQARLARLALKVAGNMENIVSVTKLIFRLSKDESNDVLFIEEGLVDEVTCLLEASRQQELPADGKIFAVGVIKNSALNENSRVHMVHAGTVGVLARLLQEQEAAGAGGDRAAQLLVQITGALRNLSSASGDLLTTVQHDVKETGIFESLAWILESYVEHEELVLNISRMLHKLTLHMECREALIAVPHFVGGLLRTLVIVMHVFSCRLPHSTSGRCHTSTIWQLWFGFVSCSGMSLRVMAPLVL